jgi:hypothetical protein
LAVSVLGLKRELEGVGTGPWYGIRGDVPSVKAGKVVAPYPSQIPGAVPLCLYHSLSYSHVSLPIILPSSRTNWRVDATNLDTLFRDETTFESLSLLIPHPQFRQDLLDSLYLFLWQLRSRGMFGM